MVKVPGGRFQMGSEDGDFDETPVHTEQVAKFWMDKYEVTMEQYAECVKAGRCKKSGKGEGCNADRLGKEKHPANCVSWNDARDYCLWAGKRLDVYKRQVYRRQPAARTVLLLCDVSSDMRPWTRRSEALIDGLRRRSVPLVVRYFDGQAEQVSERPHGPRQPLSQVQKLYPDAALLVLSAGVGATRCV